MLLNRPCMRCLRALNCKKGMTSASLSSGPYTEIQWQEDVVSLAQFTNECLYKSLAMLQQLAHVMMARQLISPMRLEEMCDDDEETSELGYRYINASPLSNGALLAACACKEET